MGRVGDGCDMGMCDGAGCVAQRMMNAADAKRETSKHRRVMFEGFFLVVLN